MTDRILLGEGYLSWNAVERRSDRYGTVRLFGGKHQETDVPLANESTIALEGQMGSLVAVVQNTRKCQHCGDKAREIYPPKKPLPIGTEIVLGSGELFIDVIGENHEKGELERQDDRMMDVLHDLLGEAPPPKYGVVFKIWDENGKEYLLMVPFDEKGMPSEPQNVEDKGFRAANKDMAKNAFIIVEYYFMSDLSVIIEASISEVAHTLSGIKGPDSPFEMLQKCGTGDSELFMAFLKQVRGFIVKYKQQAQEPEKYHQVGLRPHDDRQQDWLNPHQLYKVLQQDVALYFQPF